MAKIEAPVVTTPVMSVRIAGTLDAAGGTARPCGNTLYYRLSNQVVTPTKAALSAIVLTSVVAVLKLATNVRYHPNTLNIRDIGSASDAEVSFVAAGAGAIATDSEPSNDAIVICLKSLYRGGQGRAFKHFGGPSEVDTTGDVLTGASLALWQNVRDATKMSLVDAPGNTWTPFIRCNFNAEYVTPPLVVRGYDVVGGYLQTVVGTMRRRKTKGIKSI